MEAQANPNQIHHLHIIVKRHIKQTAKKRERMLQQDTEIILSHTMIGPDNARDW